MLRSSKERPLMPSEKDTKDAKESKVGITSDQQRDLVAPTDLNQRGHGAAEDAPAACGTVNLDDDDLTHPRGKTTATGGTWQAQGGDSAPLGPPREILSDRNGPSDPD